MTRQETERQILNLLATERIYRPISSISGKLERRRPKLAQAVDLNGRKSFNGERVYAKINEVPGTKARGMKEGIEKFCEEFPEHGETLREYIAEERAIRETNMHFGMYEGRRLTADDYMSVMTSMGFSEATAETLYPELMEVSRKMAKKKGDFERSILINSTL